VRRVVLPGREPQGFPESILTSVYFSEDPLRESHSRCSVMFIDTDLSLCLSRSRAYPVALVYLKGTAMNEAIFPLFSHIGELLPSRSHRQA